MWKNQKLGICKAGLVPERPFDALQPPGYVVGVDKSAGILIKTGNGLLAVRELQLPARKSLDFRSFINGCPDLTGSLLGDLP